MPIHCYVSHPSLSPDLLYQIIRRLNRSIVGRIQTDVFLNQLLSIRFTRLILTRFRKEEHSNFLYLSKKQKKKRRIGKNPWAKTMHKRASPDPLAQFHIPSQGRRLVRAGEREGEKETRMYSLSSRIFRPRLFSKRMDLPQGPDR